jgi:flagellar biosynthesis protein FlhB
VSEKPDDSQKTEEPTQRKFDEARKKGQVASSRELNHWFMLSAAALVILGLGPGAVAELAAAMRPFVEAPHLIAADFDHLRLAVARLLGAAALALSFALGLLAAAAAAAGLVQHGLLLSAESLKPKLEKISPLSGAKRLFSARSLTEFVKGVAKIGVVGGVGAWLLAAGLDGVAATVTLDPAALLRYAHERAFGLMIGVSAVVALVAGADLLYQRFEFRKSMRMTRQELKDELKQSDGDPQVKAKLRQLRMERARRRMMAAVPTADVVVTNPTHYAVALGYDSATMSAPKVVAKGQDLVALRIRELAREHGVPVVENPPLARALHAAVELDQEIPPEHYKAVAEVIGYVLRLKGKMPRRP